MSNEQEERWYVQFDSQEVRLMTLDELDDAFQKGLVHEETYVIPVGASNWQTLGEILGGDDSDDGEAAESEAPEEPAIAAAPESAGPVVSSVVAPVPTAAQAPSAWPPVATAGSSLLPTPQSVMPVVQDVSVGGFDEDAAAFKPKKGKVAIFAAVALAAIGGLGFAITRLDTPPGAESTAHAAALAPAPATPPTPYTEPAKPSTEPEPAAAAPAPATPSSDSATSSSKEEGSSASSGKLSEDMKAALLASDKDRAEAKKKGRATKVVKAAVTRRASSKSGSGGGSSPIKSGGNTHDPLNGSL